MVRMAQQAGSIIIRMDPLVDLADPNSAGMLHIQGKSGECLPRIVTELRAFMSEPFPAPLILPTAAALEQPAKSKSAAPKRASISTAKRGTNPAPKSPARSTRLTRPTGEGSSSASSARRGVASGDTKGGTGAFAAAASLSLARPSSSCARSASPGHLRSDKAQGFFVYGTLRPDDDSGASWTKPFAKDLVAEAAWLPGASLYVDGQFPAVCLEQTRCCVFGMFLRPGSGADARTLMDSKLEESDRIEGYPDLYDRTIVTVQASSGNSWRAHVYHRTGRTDREKCPCILDGNWMSRKRST